MKKTALLLGALVLAALAGTAGAVATAVPCYEWDCSAGDGNCDFDASCSGANGVWSYSWFFGDGTRDVWNSTPFASHFYPIGSSWSNVTLTLALFSQPDESVTCSITYRNVIGPPDDLVAECPDWDACNCP